MRTYLYVLIAGAFVPAALLAQTFDNSGNSLLQGNFFIRQVALDNIASSGLPGRARALTAAVSFDGNGNYSLTGQVSDSTVSSGQPQALTFKGVYAVSSSGLLRMQNPISTADSIYGGIGASAIVGSSSESSVFDMMVGVPVSGTVTNASLQGQYRVGAIDFTGANAAQTRNASFLVNADGNGKLGTLSVAGHAANLGDSGLTQSVSNAVYSLSGSGTSAANTLTFPLPSGGTAQSQLLSGTKQFAVSSDGSIFVGGGLNAYDIEIGVKVQGATGNSTYAGTYFSAGMDYDNSQAGQTSYYVDGFYGSVNGNGAGTAIEHERVNPSDNFAYDFTFDDEFSVAADGSVNETFENFYVANGGKAILLVGASTLYSLQLSVPARTLPVSGSVVLSPIGVVNSANYAPITNPIAPGEFINLYGTGLSPATMTSFTAPFPTILGGVSVKINGRPAPLYFVSPTQLVCVVPFATSESYAQVQVSNNGTNSNIVTVFADNSAPGVFTIGQNGIGDGATLHTDGSLVSTAKPAKIGETVTVYATGLGAVKPALSGDGVAAPSSPLSVTTDNFGVFVDGTQATVTFAGLAPGFVGLYQVNFTIPAGVSSGEVFLDLSDGTTGAYTSLATIPISK